MVTESDELDSINYRPKTKESKVAYEGILAMVQTAIGDQPHDVLRGAAEEILSMLKDDKMRDPERHSEVEKLLGSKITPENFNRLVNLGKQITDFVEGEAPEAEDDEEGKLDEDMGVAVVFDHDSEEEEEDELDEIREEEELDDDALGGVEAMASSKLARGLDSDDEDMDDDDQYALNVKDIDAHWLQRKLSQ